MVSGAFCLFGVVVLGPARHVRGSVCLDFWFRVSSMVKDSFPARGTNILIAVPIIDEFLFSFSVFYP